MTSHIRTNLPATSTVYCPDCGEPLSVYGIEVGLTDAEMHHRFSFDSHDGLKASTRIAKNMPDGESIRIGLTCPNTCEPLMTIEITASQQKTLQVKFAAI